MIKINANGNDISGLLENFAKDVASYANGSVEIETTKGKITLKNIDMKFQGTFNGITGNVDCRLKNDNLEVNVELKA